MSRNLLCVDLSNAAYKAAATHLSLSSGRMFTGGLYGFMMAIAAAIRDTGATSIVLCTDSKPYRRSLLYPEYKRLRENTKDHDLADKVKETIRLIREFSKITGWPVWSVPGFESDDLIAHATIRYRNRYNNIVAMSNDSDLYQLFEFENFSLYKGKKGIFTHLDYYKEWGTVPPHELYLALAMIGTHNEVEGIKGIGPATAKKYLNDGVAYETLRMKHRKVLERNEELIRLPHPAFDTKLRIPLHTDVYSERAVMRFCAKYDIQFQRWMGEAFEKLK